MWDPGRGTIALLDFEKSETGIAVEDFVWLFATIWPLHPHLKTACLTGFGRHLDEAERRALRLFTALAAVSYLDAGVTQPDPVVITRGREALRNLLPTSG